MKLAKKQWILAITAICVMALLLFLVINISMTYMHIPFFEKAAEACSNLKEGDKCSFVIGPRELSGTCERDRLGMLSCRHQRQGAKQQP